MAQSDSDTIDRLYRRANAARWDVPQDLFAAALDAGVCKAFAGGTPSPHELDRHLDSLHLEDLALACACALGHEAAWDHFMAEYRPALYRAAGAIDPSGGARELADSLYAELYGVRGERPGRESLFRYFHGRSSLATWLRAILSQRHVDRIRAGGRLEPLPEHAEETLPALSGTNGPATADHQRFVALIVAAFSAAVAALAAKDRLRLRAYYEQDLTLAQIGKLTGEHEATVSRQLAKVRKTLRRAIDDRLERSGLTEPERHRCWSAVMEDSGAMDLKQMLSPTPGAAERKNAELDRS
jgi:RNA polymerase sigma-70 factor